MSITSQPGAVQVGNLQPGAIGPLGPREIQAALVKKIWAGPFAGLYRGQYVGQGSPVEIPPAEAVSTWFR